MNLTIEEYEMIKEEINNLKRINNKLEFEKQYGNIYMTEFDFFYNTTLEVIIFIKEKYKKKGEYNKDSVFQIEKEINEYIELLEKERKEIDEKIENVLHLKKCIQFE